MNFKYKYLTPGYLGERVSDATLNSKFFSELFSKSIDLQRAIIFPQKIPKTGFFDELCALESEGTIDKFNNFTNNIKIKAYDLLNDCERDHESRQMKLNLLRILTRYGCFKDVIAFEIAVNEDLVDAELSFIIESAKIDFCISNDVSINLDGLLKLANRIINSNKVEPWLKCAVLNRFIVCTYKHCPDNYLFRSHAKDFAHVLLSTVKTLDNSILSSLISSLVYRGIAMVNEWGNDLQNKFMDTSFNIAKNLSSSNFLESIVIQDNLYPCLQSITKWNLINNNIEAAEEALTDMINLDPFDATGYSEMGLFMLKRGRFKEASFNFKYAAQLGVPGIGMNTYFYAKSLQELGQDHDAITALYEVTEIDKVAISPWLDLFDYYLKIGNVEKLRDISQHIIASTELREQLEEHEFAKLQEVLN